MNVLKFKNIKKKQYDICGGKGASLVKLIKSGFNVPDGFIVCSDIFDKIIKNNNLNEKIENELSKCKINDEKSIEKSSKNIRNFIYNVIVPSEIGNKVLELYDELKLDSAAVRSSATSEDSKSNAWAGQLETFLYINKHNLIENIKKCWASLFNTRAIYYRIKNKLNSIISVAVVVQKMINSDISGIAFSINPANQKSEYIIEAVFGQGEAIVSGAVTPDKYIINPETFEIINKSHVKQNKKLIRDNIGLQWVPVTGDNLKLNDDQINLLSKQLNNIRNFYNFDVDVEWAIEQNKIFIIQCRPVTTNKVSEIDKLIETILKSQKWIFYVKRPFHWLLESTQILGGSKEEQVKYLGFDMALQNYLILNGDEYFSQLEDETNYNKLHALLNKNINFFDDYAVTLFKIVNDIKQYIECLNKERFEHLTNKHILEKFIEFKNNYIKSVVPTFARPDSFLEKEFYNYLRSDYNFSLKKCDDIFKNIATCSNDYGPLFYSEEPLDLLKLALKFTNDINFEQELNSHIKKYSWLKGPAQKKMTSFTKEDYISRIEDLIKGGKIKEKIKNTYAVRNQNDINFDNTIRKYKLSGKTLKMAKTLRTFIFLRTYMTEHTDYLLFNGRTTILSEICKRSKITDEILVMLSLNEIEDLISNNFNFNNNFYNKIQNREKGFAIIWLGGIYKCYFNDNALELQSRIGNELISEESSTKTKIIKGDIANKGKVTGIARILNTYNDIYKVNHGDIIVASMTTPDYISAMEKAIGFITDEGGITCHAAIISREFNIPCIVGTINATKLIKDGQLIELDAFTGVVKIV